MARINFIDGDSMTAGVVQVHGDWVKCLRHSEGDDGKWTEEQTIIPKHRVSSITSQARGKQDRQQVTFSTD